LFNHAPDMVEPEETDAGGLLKLRVTRVSTHRHRVRVRSAATGQELTVETVNLSTSGGRQKVIKNSVSKLELSEQQKAALSVAMDEALIAKSQEGATAAENPARESLEYFAIEDDD